MDLCHRLFLTSLVVFFPIRAQLPVAMGAVFLYTALILMTNAFLRPADDLLLLVGQVELLCLLSYGLCVRMDVRACLFVVFVDAGVCVGVGE